MSARAAGVLSAWATRTYVTGISSDIQTVQRLIAEIAPTEIPVLILGESGTGKELTALHIHALSKRSNLPFIKVSCAKFSPETLVGQAKPSENGHGLSDESSVGTLLLDNLGELDPSNQRELLHAMPDESVVLDKHITGSRIISTATPDLESQVHDGRFRSELFYRLNGAPLRLPPLRHRREDVSLLVEHFLDKYAEIFGRAKVRLSDVTMQTLRDHAWPGNIRELENVIKKIVALESEELGIADLKSCPAGPRASPCPSLTRSLKQAARTASRQAERELILQTLSRTHWNRKKAAVALQISYKALLYKLKQIQVAENGDL
jgi:two-component system, NtrC family, response regulator AtoC